MNRLSKDYHKTCQCFTCWGRAFWPIQLVVACAAPLLSCWSRLPQTPLPRCNVFRGCSCRYRPPRPSEIRSIDEHVCECEYYLWRREPTCSLTLYNYTELKSTNEPRVPWCSASIFSEQNWRERRAPTPLPSVACRTAGWAVRLQFRDCKWQTHKESLTSIVHFWYRTRREWRLFFCVRRYGLWVVVQEDAITPRHR